MAMVGGVSFGLQGGSFNDGFIVSALSAGAAPYAGNVVKAALIGGAISSINGGKFSTGAVTAAMGYAFNWMKHEGSEDVFNGDRRVTKETGRSREHWNGIDSVKWQEVSVDEVLGFIAKKPFPELSVKTGIEYGYREYESQVGVESYQAVFDGSSWGGNVASTVTKPIQWTPETVWKPSSQNTTELSRRRYGGCISKLCWN